MWCAERWLVLALLSGCSFVNRIDTCDDPKPVEVQVNALGSGDQLTAPGMAVARLASGGFVAVWLTRTGTSGAEQTEVRAALLSKDGKPAPACGSASADLRVSTVDGAELLQPVVAAGLTQDSAVYIAWSQLDPGQTTRTVQLRLFTQDLCNWAVNAPHVVTVSELAEDSVTPSLAVRRDGQEALLTWLAFPPGLTANRVRVRPVGPGVSSNASEWVHECDNLPTSCVVDEDAVLGPPVITSTSLGYAMAWSGPRDDGAAGWGVRLQSFDHFGGRSVVSTSWRQFGPAQRVFLSMAANDVEVALAMAIENGPNANEADRGVFLERFTPKLIFEDQPDSQILVTGGSQIQAVTRVDPPAGGLPHRPAVHLFAGGQALLTWTSELTGGVSELRGTLVTARNETMFNGLACDVSDFQWPTARASNDSMASSLAGEGTRALALFHSPAPVSGGGDSFGTSVHALSLDFEPLVPLLK